MKFKHLGNFLLAILLAGLVASCEPPAADLTSQKIRAGTMAQFKVSGQIYTGKVIQAKEGYALWEITWKKKPVFEYKTYRGLMTVYSKEEGIKHWSKFDTKALDNFLPLRVGNEIVIKGRHFTSENENGYPFFVTITVRKETEMGIKGEAHRVFVLDYSAIEEHPDGERFFTKIAWYSPEMEAALRTDYVFDNAQFSMRIVAFGDENGFEGEEDNQPEGLGTIRL